MKLSRWLLGLFILSHFSGCGSPSAEEPTTSPAVIDNTILRPQGQNVLSRDLKYKNDPTISYCEITENNSQSYSGFRDLKPYALASVSKVFLSSWALKTLGSDFRFKMNWKLKKISNNGTYDAYLQTNYDPIINIEKMLFAISELNKIGVLRIRTLIIDETTRIYLSVLSNPHLELADVPVTTAQTIDNLQTILNSKNWAGQTDVAKNNLTNINLPVNLPSQFSVETVTYSPKNKIQSSYYDQSVQIESAPLFKYIKNMNVYSNNYVTDALFDFLGGATQFLNFQNSELKISKNELKIYTGSGLSLQIDNQRKDNLGSCLSVLKTMRYLDLLTQAYNLNLGHVLLSAGQDLGTYESTLNFNKNVVLKTGRLFDVPTLNVAGVDSTRFGSTYFTMMAHDFDNADETLVKAKRDDLIDDLIQSKPQQATFLTLKQDTLFFKQ